MNKNYFSLYFILLCSLILSACSNNFGRYQQQHDSTPTRLPNAIELRDAIPRDEAKSKGGNRDYQVRGKSYHVLSSAENFTQTGIASWYGKKFHGHLTSNGEIYNMYSMSAAHKNLPLPTYLKVTNLDNNKSVIVRVNDRGPFHQSRIIDLSYSAAYKLNMLKTGTANVRIEAITNFSNATPNVLTKNKQTPNYIQILATSNKQVAQQKAKKVSAMLNQPVKVQRANQLFKVHVGPINDLATLNLVLNKIQKKGYPKAFKLNL